MNALLPDGHHRQPTTTPSLTEFCTSLELLRARGVTVLADVTFSAMWTAQHSKIQRLISQQLQLQRQQRELASLSNLPPAHAAAVHNPLSPDDFAFLKHTQKKETFREELTQKRSQLNINSSLNYYLLWFVIQGFTFYLSVKKFIIV